MRGPDISHLLMSLLVGLIELAVFVLIVVLAIVNRRTFRAYWKTGLVLGLVIFVTLLPSVILTIAYLDLDTLLEEAGPSVPSEVAEIAVYAGIAVGVGIAVLKVGWHMVVYHVAASEWGRLGPGYFPILQRSGRSPWWPVAGAAAFGVAAGVLSMLVFLELGVEESEFLRRALQKMFPGLESLSPPVLFLVMVLWVTAAALVEELTYRGALCGFLLRLRPGSRVMEAVASLVTSLLWAVLQAPNTDFPFVKCVQIFILGLVFFEFAKRRGVEAAIAAHLGLNVSAVVLAIVLQ